MVATTASSFKSCVIIQIILYVVAIVEMITNYLSITTYNQVAAIGFISAIPFLRRRHAECCIKKQHLHFVFVKSLNVAACKTKGILLCNNLDCFTYL